MEEVLLQIRTLIDRAKVSDNLLVSLRKSCIELKKKLQDTYQDNPNPPMEAPPSQYANLESSTGSIGPEHRRGSLDGLSPFIDTPKIRDSILRNIAKTRKTFIENTNHQLLPLLKANCSGLIFLLQNRWLVGVLDEYVAYILSGLNARNPVLRDVMTYAEARWNRIWTDKKRTQEINRSKIGLEELMKPQHPGEGKGHIVEVLEGEDVVRYVPGHISDYDPKILIDTFSYNIDPSLENFRSTPTVHIWINPSSKEEKKRDYYIHYKGNVGRTTDVVDFLVFRGEPVYMINNSDNAGNQFQQLCRGSHTIDLDKSWAHGALATCGDKMYVLAGDDVNAYWWITECRINAGNKIELVTPKYSTYKMGSSIVYQFLVMNLMGQHIYLVHSEGEIFAGTVEYIDYAPTFKRIQTDPPPRLVQASDLENVACIGAHTSTDGDLDLAIYMHPQVSPSSKSKMSDSVVWMRGKVERSANDNIYYYRCETQKIDNIPRMFVSGDNSDHPFTQMHRSVLRVENDWAQQIWIGHGSAITSVSATPDMSFLASVSGGQDNSVRVWRRDQPHCVARHSHHKLPITRVFITPDGKKVISGTKADYTEPVSDDDEEFGKDPISSTDNGKSNIELVVLHVGPSDVDASKAGPCITIDQVIDDNWVTCIHSDYEGSRIVFGTHKGEVGLLTEGHISHVHTVLEAYISIVCVQVGQACVLTVGHMYNSSEEKTVSSVYYNTHDITTCSTESIEEDLKYAPLTNISTICIHEDSTQNIITLYAGTMDGTLVILKILESGQDEKSPSVRLKSRFSTSVNVGSLILHIHRFAEEGENVQRVLLFTEKGCHVVEVNSTKGSISLHSSLLCGDLSFTGPICAGINGGLVSILSAGPHGKEDRLVLRTEETCVKMVYGTDMAVRARWQDET